MPNTARTGALRSVIGKASVLLEAMPYLQAFRGKTFVVKSGGAALTDPSARRQLLMDMLFLSLSGIRPVLVHGGGASISGRLKTQGETPRFVQGLRVTDLKTLRVVIQTLDQVNRQLVLELHSLGGKAVGLSGVRQKVLRAERLKVSGQDLGFVGRIERVDPRPVEKALRENLIPIVIPLAIGKKGQVYNVNADQAGAALAGALGAEKFVLITDVRGILRDQRETGSLLSTVSARQARQLIAQGIIRGGMIPKTQACIQALSAGVGKTHMIDFKIPHGLLLEIFTDRGIGTEIVLS